MTMDTLRIMMTLALSWVVQGQILVRRRDLTVNVGRSVFLEREDLVFVRARRGVDCRVEVVDTDPITQRVGTIEPPIFDCDFLSKTVKYVHNGSPLLYADEVKLRAHRFTQTSTITETFYLRVRIVNASHEVIVTRGLRPVVVPKFNGLSNTIDSSVIRFRNSDNHNVSCTVGFSKYHSHWPLVGQMVMGADRHAVDAVKKDCREFLFMQLHYEHLRSPTPDVDYLPLTVEIFDPMRSDEVVSENFYLPIYIKGALPNSPPKNKMSSMNMMDVDQFILTTIIPGVISAEDYETPSNQLVYNISRAFPQGHGYLVKRGDHATPITSFLQDDLENHRIAYRPPNVSFSERRMYEVEFTVYDSHFSNSMPLRFHVAVHPSSTNAPRVAHNLGLVLLEGQSRAISTDILQIVDRDNLDRVKLYVKGGLQYGNIEVHGSQSIVFRPTDLLNGGVVYHHDDSDSTKDRIELRLSDGSNTVLFTFPISIIPKDDTPPHLINNLGLQINEGDMKKISEDLLLAHDTDSLDSNIIYTILATPKTGDIIRKVRPSDSGTKIFGFRQRDLLKGQIYYRHSGREEFRDSFRFTLQDQQEPPNESEQFVFHILINPMNENPPRLALEATRLLFVPETDIAYLSSTELQYTDVESEDRQLTFTITTPPYFVYNRGERDAGRLISTHNLTMMMKDGSTASAQTFTQEDINHMKIAYMPPMNDIGAESRLVRFVYTVEDSSRNRLYGQTFDIEVLPVNNRVPQFVTSKLLVEEGGILSITSNQLSANDVDTSEEKLRFMLDALPRYGILQKGGIALRRGEGFNIADLEKKDIRYVHDGSEYILDTFTLSVSDGLNSATKVISIDIVPIDDETPQMTNNLRPFLIVSEGGDAIVTQRTLSATDADTDESSLVFLIVRQPKFGILQLESQPVTKFTQTHVKEGKVSYLHTSGEIGITKIHDVVTFIVSDQNFLPSADMPMYDLNITVTPVNNQKPTINLGNPVFVSEGEIFKITSDILSVSDPDSRTKDIELMITKQPQWGFLENTKPSPGSERSNAGVRINMFKFRDVLDGSINYVQANHKGVEPVRDEFSFYATDGKLNSPTENIAITIVPANDEVPDLMLRDFSVPEGGSKMIDQSMVDAIDLDMPKDSLVLTVSQRPEHGNMVMMLHTRKGEVETDIHDFTIDELHSGMQLKYVHDGSETYSDKFAVTVSDGKHEIKRVCNVSVKLNNDERPEIIKNAGLHLDYGESALISSVVLQATDEDNGDAQLYYIIVQLPKKGFLQFCPDPFSNNLAVDCRDFQEGQNFTQHDVDQNKIRYIHTTSMGSTESDSFMFVLTDNRYKRPEETFEIRIANSKKANIALLNRGMAVREGERVAISTSNLSASDESTKAEEIVFAVIRAPRLGQIEYIDQPFTPISSFTQLDIASQKVVYNHLTKNDIIEDSFTFTVTNGLSEAKDGEFRIVIQPLDQVLPSLVANKLLEVLQGTEEVVTPLQLKVTDPDTSAMNLTYVIAKPPTYGKLYNRGVPIKQSFTQNEVDLGFVTYESDGTRAGLDNFLFKVNDGRHEGFLINGTLQTKPAMSSIFIKPLIEDAPKLVTKKHPNNLEYFGGQRYGYVLNNRVLRVVDSDTESSGLVYIMLQKPKHGHIENTASKRFVRRRFTQQDLDDESLMYIINKADKSTNDSFTFKVEDSRGNAMDEQVFEMKWSRIEFLKEDVVVCENVGTLSVTLERTGAIDQSAFIGINVRQMSARRDDDFSPSSAKQVQFDPGKSQATWDITIKDDGIEENNEKLRLILADPINAVIGDQRKLRLRIINAEHGECPQYLGMVSKNRGEDQLAIEENMFVPSRTDANKDTIVTYHRVNKLAPVNTFENAFLNTEPKTVVGKEIESQPKPAMKKRKQSKKNRKKKKKKKKDKKNRKNKRNQSIPKSPKKDPSPSSAPVKNIKKCTASTKDLLTFDNFKQQLLKCNGKEWQVWTSASNSDERPRSSLCQADWSEYEGRCYKFMNDKLPWDEAEQLCFSSYQAHMTSVHSIKHLKWLFEQAGKKSFWIGLNDKRQTGVWKYINGDPVGVTNWKNGRPRVKRMLHKKNCVVVKKRMKWRNKHCDKYNARFICELSVKGQQARQHKRSRKGPSRRHVRRDRKVRNGGGFFFG
ncbi:FRAS1-related extracellular matrix protein 1-like [Haliotis asinina]|uniref:FRAS1-related extracellular matrix protein 1-like n=1 Tax=Haliotis asinina TaxID=109174 RepID=UPI0035324A7E